MPAQLILRKEGRALAYQIGFDIARASFFHSHDDSHYDTTYCHDGVQDVSSWSSSDVLNGNPGAYTFHGLLGRSVVIMFCLGFNFSASGSLVLL